MSNPTAELSSIASALSDLNSRVGRLAEGLSEAGGSDMAHELFEVERALSAGTRRLEGLVRKKS
jgi:hypothetical protein